MTNRTIFGGLAVLAVMAATTGLIPKSERTGSKVPRVETVGLPEHGLMLVGPADAGFDKLIAGASAASDARAFSVFVVNQANLSVAACLVKWDLADGKGQTITHTRSYESALETVSDGGHAHLSNGLVPNGSLLFSPIDSGDRFGVRFKVGGGSGSDIVSQLSRSATIRASIDGALFVDGTFVGRDSTNYFERLKAQTRASRDLYEEIGRLISSGAEARTALRPAEELAGNQTHFESRSDQDGGYLIMKRTSAARLQLMRKMQGDQAALDFVRAELSKPRINLRKL